MANWLDILVLNAYFTGIAGKKQQGGRWGEGIWALPIQIKTLPSLNSWVTTILANRRKALFSSKEITSSKLSEILA